MGSILQLLGFSAIIFAGIVYLAKILINAFVSSGVEQYKAQLQLENQKRQNQFTVEFEKIRHEYELLKQKYQILHGQKIEIIKEMYSKLVEFDQSLKWFVSSIKPMGNMTEREFQLKEIEEMQQAHKLRYDWFKYFLVNAIYFDDRTSELIDRLNKHMNDALFEKGYMISQRVSVGMYEKMAEKIETAMTLSNEIHRQLKNTLREELGVIRPEQAESATSKAE